jgi:hypothetical protein
VVEGGGVEVDLGVAGLGQRRRMPACQVAVKPGVPRRGQVLRTECWMSQLRPGWGRNGR